MEAARTVVDRVCSDLRSGVTLPTCAIGGVPVPSAVLWPDSYGDQSVGSHPRYILREGDGTEVHVSRNRLVFTRLREGTLIRPEEAAHPRDFEFVEYVVRPASPNQLLRRLHRVDARAGDAFPGLVLDLASRHWTVSLDSFAGSGRLNPVEPDEIVVSLPGDGDTIEFTVSHKRILSDVTGQPAVEEPFGTRFDRNLFDVQVRVRMTRVVRGENRTKVGELKGQARVQSLP